MQKNVLQNNILESYMGDMCFTMGMEPAINNPFGCGSYMVGDGLKTQGFFWFIVHGNHFAVTMCDFVFCRDTRFTMPSDMLYLSLRLDYTKHLPPGKLLAFMEEKGSGASIVMDTGTRVAYTEVLYIPAFYSKHLKTAFTVIDENPIEILKNMGGEHNWPAAMVDVLSDIYKSELTGISRELFCVAKSYELMAVLLAMGKGRLPKKSTDYEAILRVIRHIDQNYAGKCRQADLVKLANMSSTKLKNLFRKFTGLTITEYILDKKTDHAAHLLADTDLSVEEIAKKVGFDTATGFATSFKKQLGIPPTEYRKQIQFNCFIHLDGVEKLTSESR